MSGFARILLALLILSTLVALYRGIASAATANYDWFGGYDDAINSVRIAKSLLFGLLLFPLLKVEQHRSGLRALELLGSGLTAGLGLGSMVVVWEHTAFPGLLNFSSTTPGDRHVLGDACRRGRSGRIPRTDRAICSMAIPSPIDAIGGDIRRRPSLGRGICVPGNVFAWRVPGTPDFNGAC